MFGFLVSDSCGKKRIELLSGEIKIVGNNQNSNNKESVSEEFECEEEIVEGNWCTTTTRKYKDGRTEVDFRNRLQYIGK